MNASQLCFGKVN